MVEWMGVVEQQLGEKPPRTSTCSWEENPRPAVPLIQASRAGPEILNNFDYQELECYYHCYDLKKMIIFN